MDVVNEWLQNMSKELGKEIKLDEDGGCSIECEEDVTVIIDSQEDSPVFHLSSPLMEIPAVDKEVMLKFLTKALSLNLYTFETRGATIAMAEDIGQIMICFMQEKEFCDENRFPAIIEGFQETVLNIRQRLQDVAGA